MSRLIDRIPPWIEVVSCASEDEWLNARAGFLPCPDCAGPDCPRCGGTETVREFRIGASQVADALNVPREFGGCYQGAFALGHELLGGIRIEPSDPDALAYGHAYEDCTARMWARTSGYIVETLPPYTMMRNPQYPWLQCTPDRLFGPADGEWIGVLECKSLQDWSMDDWDADGEPPLRYQLQVLAQMICCGVERGAIAATFRGSNKKLGLRHCTVDYKPEMVEVILDGTKAFVDGLYQGIVPDPDGHAMAQATLRRLHPKDSGETVVLPEESAGWASEYEALRKAAADAEFAFESFKACVKAALGSATWGKGADGTLWSWKTQGGRPTGIVVPLDAKAALDAAGVQYEVKNSPESRVLRVKKA